MQRDLHCLKTFSAIKMGVNMFQTLEEFEEPYGPITRICSDKFRHRLISAIKSNERWNEYTFREYCKLRGLVYNGYHFQCVDPPFYGITWYNLMSRFFENVAVFEGSYNNMEMSLLGIWNLYHWLRDVKAPENETRFTLPKDLLSY